LTVFQGVSTVASSTNRFVIVKLFAVGIHLDAHSGLEVVTLRAFLTDTVGVESFAVDIVRWFGCIVDAGVVGQTEPRVAFGAELSLIIEGFAEGVDLNTDMSGVEVKTSRTLHAAVILELFAVRINSSQRLNHATRVFQFPARETLQTDSIGLVETLAIGVYLDTDSFRIHEVVPCAKNAGRSVVLGTSGHCAFGRGNLACTVDQSIASVAFGAKESFVVEGFAEGRDNFTGVVQQIETS
jgi:hypothetical protein